MWSRQSPSGFHEKIANIFGGIHVSVYRHALADTVVTVQYTVNFDTKTCVAH